MKRCAHPQCQYATASGGWAGGFCCKRCYQAWEHDRKPDHGQRCDSISASEDVGRALPAPPPGEAPGKKAVAAKAQAVKPAIRKAPPPWPPGQTSPQPTALGAPQAKVKAEPPRTSEPKATDPSFGRTSKPEGKDPPTTRFRCQDQACVCKTWPDAVLQPLAAYLGMDVVFRTEGPKACCDQIATKHPEAARIVADLIGKPGQLRRVFQETVRMHLKAERTEEYKAAEVDGCVLIKYLCLVSDFLPDENCAELRQSALGKALHGVALARQKAQKDSILAAASPSRRVAAAATAVIAATEN